MKKNVLYLIGILIAMLLTACSNKPEASDEVMQNIQAEQAAVDGLNQNEAIELYANDTEMDMISHAYNNEQKSNMPLSSGELLDLFINGSIDAVDSTNVTSTFHITELNQNPEAWDSYSVGEKIDLDNDGEDELILCGPYGGIYLDARDNMVYEFAAGDGTANTLSYTYYNGEIWILYSNSMNTGYEAYHMVKFEGADNLVAEMNFGEELIDATNPESGMKYLLNGKEISYDEYAAFCSKIFAAEESTN